MLGIGVEKLKTYIKTIGLYNNKAKNVISLSQELVDKYRGEVPFDRSALESLPGVGRKTANVVLNVWFNQPTIAVDTHVMRISHRLEFSDGKTPLDIEKDLNAVLPDNYKKNANHWLVLFGRYICKSQKPDCANCPGRFLLPQFRQKNLAVPSATQQNRQSALAAIFRTRIVECQNQGAKQAVIQPLGDQIPQNAAGGKYVVFPMQAFSGHNLNTAFLPQISFFYKIFNFSEGFLGRTAVQIQNCLNRKLTALKPPHGVCINIVGSPRNQKA